MQDSNAKWYFDRASDEDNLRFYEVFSNALQKYNVQWCSATPEEKFFIEEVVRIEIEREKARRTGGSMDHIVPAFSYYPAAC